MTSKKNLVTRIDSLEAILRRTIDDADKSIRLFKKQLECSLTRHMCGHEGHLFQFVNKTGAETGVCNSGNMLVVVSVWQSEHTDPNKDKVGGFKCKFCDITTTRLMSDKELQAADKLELGN